MKLPFALNSSTRRLPTATAISVTRDLIGLFTTQSRPSPKLARALHVPSHSHQKIVPGLQTGSSTAARDRNIEQLTDISKNFAVAAPLASDLIPLLARGVREQTELTSSVAAKAPQRGAKQPLPRISASSSTDIYTTTNPAPATHHLKMAAIDDGAGQGSNINAAAIDSAGNKTFEMQTREVDAVKAVTPLAAKPNITNSGNFGAGKPNEDHPYKGKRKSAKHNKHANAKNNTTTEQPNSLPATPLKASLEQHQLSHGGVDPDGSAGAMNGRKFSNKYRSETSDWNSQGKSHAGPNGRGNFNNKIRGGGSGRPHRSNTCDDDRTLRHNSYHNNGGFHSVRGDPRGQLYDPSTSKTNVKNNSSPAKSMVNSNIANDSFAMYPQHPYDEPIHDTFGYTSPSGMWRPHMQPSYGPPPAFTQPQATMTPPLGMGVLIPLPFAPARQNQVLAPQDTAQVLPSVTGMKGVTPVITGSNEHPPIELGNSVLNTAAASEVPAEVTTSKIDSPLSNPSTAITSSIYDPRPAHMRIEGLMTTIVGELQHLKLRITPGVEHRLSVSDMARYLDTCMDLCKLVGGASVELSKENAALWSRLEGVPGMAAAPTNAVVCRDGVPNAGSKIGRDHITPQQHLSVKLPIKTVNANNVNFDQYKEHSSNVADHTLPSGAQTHFIPQIPTYAGYCIGGPSDGQSNCNTNVEHMTGGQPWWVQKKQHEFLEGEKGSLKLAFAGKGAVKNVAKEGAKEVATGG
jgi:hypothetical protein